MQRFRVNWTLFIVMVTIGLLFRLIQIFGAIVGDRCIGHGEYWHSVGSQEFSIFSAFTAIYLLCLAWTAIDIVLAFLQRADCGWGTVRFSFVMLLVPLLVLVGISTMYELSLKIELKLAADSKSGEYWVLPRKERDAHACRMYLPDVTYTNVGN